MEIVRIENLSFTYPESKNKTLIDIDLTVNSGEFILLCGESGCGKTTLLKMIVSVAFIGLICFMLFKPYKEATELK